MMAESLPLKTSPAAESASASQRHLLYLQQQVAKLQAENDSLRQKNRCQYQDTAESRLPKYQAMVDSLPFDYVVVRNRQGKDLSVNKAWGRLVHRTVSPEATQELESLFQQAWQEGDTVSHQIVLEGNEADSAPATTSWKVKIFPPVRMLRLRPCVLSSMNNRQLPHPSSPPQSPTKNP